MEPGEVGDIIGDGQVGSCYAVPSFCGLVVRENIVVCGSLSVYVSLGIEVEVSVAVGRVRRYAVGG